MLRMIGHGSREMVTALAQYGDAKVTINGKTCIVKGCVSDDGSKFFANIHEENDDVLGHLPQASADIQRLVDSIRWEKPIDVSNGWGSETPR